jgi:hypothetical protein
MDEAETKADLLHHLRDAREALLWKLDGLGEYDVRRPMTPTGTNLLGLVKHAAGVEAGYFGAAFGRPLPDLPDPWAVVEDDPNADMWATADETREHVIGLYRRAGAHADATVAALPLATVGRVGWWPPERNTATLHRLLVRVIADTQRHAGHADILRELLDGSAGTRPGGGDLPAGDRAWWAAHRARVERAARETGGR